MGADKQSRKSISDIEERRLSINHREWVPRGIRKNSIAEETFELDFDV